MSVSVEKLEGNLAKLTVEIAADVIDKAEQAVYLKEKNRIQLPGFRKGKAPRHMIEKMYGKGIFLEDAINETVPGVYEEAVEESGLTVVSQPQIEYTQVEPGKPVIFVATVATKPEVTLGEYKGLSVEKMEVSVSEEEIDAEVKKEQEKNATLVNVEDRPVADGDTVQIDYDGYVDGMPFDGGKADNYDLVIGSHSFIDTFEEQLIGANIGEEKQINVTFPEEYHAKELAGKPALFVVKIKGIKKNELPELDDEFASEVSEFETMAEYRENLKKQLTEKKEEQAKRELEDALVMEAVKNASMEIPDLMVETQARDMLNQFAQSLQYQGLSIDQYMSYTGSTADAMLENYKATAKSRIENSLVLEAIAKAENLEATEEEIEKEIADMAERYGMEVDKVKEYVDDAQREDIKGNIAIKKAVDLLVENAK